MNSIIKPKRPRAPGWYPLPPIPEWVSIGYEADGWYHQAEGFQVISAVEVARDADGIDRGPEYHISMCKLATLIVTGRRTRLRCTSQEAQEILRQFDVYGAEEDNHVPGGLVRNFWRPVADRFVGLECACKADEPAMVEDQGDYVWRGVDVSKAAP